jgi:hypothetical protein
MDKNIAEKSSSFIEKNIDELYHVICNCKDILPENILGMKKEFLLESPDLFLEVSSFLEKNETGSADEFLLSGGMTRFLLIIVTESMEF